MAYDSRTVLNRYQHLLEVPEGEPQTSICKMMGRRIQPDGDVASSESDDSGEILGIIHDTLGCDPGGCQSCCVGVVEVVRQFAEQQVSIETRAIEFDDILTQAGKLESK
ncbi:MAG TPA: hypothetical protein VIV60_19150 [Polyangiaceae bacterium]